MIQRETFTNRLGLLATMVGVAVGLGNVWRFPYMVGSHGGAAFVLLYLVLALGVGVPALMAEWSLGRHTQRGTLGAYEGVGVPGGRYLGWLLGIIVLAAVGYYTNAIGWVVFHALGTLLSPLGDPFDPARILPPEAGLDPTSLGLQLLFTTLVLLAEALVIVKGLRGGIERASTIITPVLFATLLLVILRSLTLPGAGEGIAWYLSFDPGGVTPSVVMAALGQLVFSLGLGGTLMLTYGSYLGAEANIPVDATLTVVGDTVAGLLAGLAIFPAVFALGLAPDSGPGLLFVTLPRIFAAIPAGWVFGSLFFVALSGAALLSGIAAYEVLVTGLVDTAGWSRRRAVWSVGAVALVLAVPPMINLRVFVPWDLTFGSGGQTFGALVAILTAGWAMKRGHLLGQLNSDEPGPLDSFLANWLRWVVPAAMVAAAVWWFLTDVVGAVPGV